MKIKTLIFLVPAVLACLSLDVQAAETAKNKAKPANTTSSVVPNNGKNGNWSSMNSKNGSGLSMTDNSGCSPMDLSIFEEADEEETYNGLGFSRGDIKSLYSYKYDPKTEMAISGNVVKILRVQFPDENCYLVAVVNTDSGDFLVNLGPVWFIDENNLEINEDDGVQIKGSKIRTNGRHIIIASEVRKNGQVLLLRNKMGNVQWGTPKAQKGTAIN